MKALLQTSWLGRIDFDSCKFTQEYWWEQWNNLATPPEIRGILIHYIFRALSVQEALNILIELADGYRQLIGWNTRDEMDERQNNSEMRRNLSCLAQETLFTAEIWKNHHNSFDLNWLLEDNDFPILAQILNFLLDRNRRELSYSNLPMNREDGYKKVRKFAHALVQAFWRKRLCRHSHTEDCNPWCMRQKEIYQSIKPDLFELMLLLGGKIHENHHILRDSEFLSDDTCIARLKNLACMRTVGRNFNDEYPYTPYASAAEALCIEGSSFASLYLILDQYHVELLAKAL